MNIILLLILSIYTYFFMKKVLKNTPEDCPLTKSEKIQVILLLLFNTLISWIMLSLGWRKMLPTKSKQVNHYMRNIILIIVAIGVLAVILTLDLTALNPNRVTP